MLEKIAQLAEYAAMSASRRQFLGQVGRGAMTLAAIVAGVLALPGEAQAAAACGQDSDIYCRGLVEGAYCQIGTTGGVCRGAPACGGAVQDPRRRRRRGNRVGTPQSASFSSRTRRPDKPLATE